MQVLQKERAATTKCLNVARAVNIDEARCKRDRQGDNMLLIRIISICLLTILFSCGISPIEQRLLVKDWDSAENLVNSLPDRYSYEHEKKKKLRSETVWVIKFLRRREDCGPFLYSTPLTNDSIICFQDLNQIWVDGPAKLPFSEQMHHRLNEVMSELWRLKPSIEKTKQQLIAEREESRRRQDEEWQKLVTQHKENLLKAAEEETRAKELYYDLFKKIAEMPEYKGGDSACMICSCMTDIQELEEAIKIEKRYADKYGVLNIGGLETAKQRIKRCDLTISEQKKNI